MSKLSRAYAAGKEAALNKFMPVAMPAPPKPTAPTITPPQVSTAKPANTVSAPTEPTAAVAKVGHFNYEVRARPEREDAIRSDNGKRYTPEDNADSRAQTRSLSHGFNNLNNQKNMDPMDIDVQLNTIGQQ